MNKTREEIIDLYFKCKALEEKSCVREVNQSVIDKLCHASHYLYDAMNLMTKIIDEGIDPECN